MTFANRVERAKRACINAVSARGLPFPRGIELVGSSFITDEITGDIDILVFIKDAQADVDVDTIGFDGWQYGGSLDEGTDIWGSWKRTVDGVDEVNMLVTFSETYYEAWLKSADVCRLMHKRGLVLSRAERVAIHNIIMDDSSSEQELADLHRSDVGVLLAS